MSCGARHRQLITWHFDRWHIFHLAIASSNVNECDGTPRCISTADCETIRVPPWCPQDDSHTARETNRKTENKCAFKYSDVINIICHVIAGGPHHIRTRHVHESSQHSMRSRVYEMVRCPSVCLSHSPAAAACDGFAAVGPAGSRYMILPTNTLQPLQGVQNAAARLVFDLSPSDHVLIQLY